METENGWQIDWLGYDHRLLPTMLHLWKLARKMYLEAGFRIDKLKGE